MYFEPFVQICGSRRKAIPTKKCGSTRTSIPTSYLHFCRERVLPRSVFLFLAELPEASEMKITLPDFLSPAKNAFLPKQMNFTGQTGIQNQAKQSSARIHLDNFFTNGPESFLRSFLPCPVKFYYRQIVNHMFIEPI